MLQALRDRGHLGVHQGKGVDMLALVGLIQYLQSTVMQLSKQCQPAPAPVARPSSRVGSLTVVLT